MPSDIEIAQACEMEPIVEVAAQAGIDEKYLEPYGRYMAKVDNISVLGTMPTSQTASSSS